VRIIERIKSFAYKEDDGRKVDFALSGMDQNRIIYRVFLAVYAFLFLLIFGAISYLLYVLRFNIASAVVFFMFMSLVLLFGFRVRYSASELNAGEEREGFFSTLLLNLSMPFLNVGALLSKGLAKINFLMMIMDFLIEAPLKTILSVVDEWSDFVRERKEEVVEVPSQ
jgi:hypothetical protein